MNLQDMNWLEKRAKTDPEKVFIRFNDNVFSYFDIDIQASRFANAINQLVPIGKVALLLDNSLEMVNLICAVTMIDAELVLINSRLHPEEVKWQVQHLNVNIIISSSKFKDLLRTLPIPSYLIDIENNFKSLELTTPIESRRLKHENDILCYAFTSGTTGRPKAVPLTYGNILSSAIASENRLTIRNDDVWLLNMPLYHLGGLSIVFRSIISNFEIVLHSNYNDELIVKDILKHKITFMSLVPTMLRRLAHKLVNLPSLRLILVGGAATPIDLLDLTLNLKLPVATTYGMTETSSQFATATPIEVMRKPGTVGKPLDGYIKIFEVQSDGIGEIGVRGPMVTSGYYGSKTQPIQDGYFRTGDLGYIDEEGDLFVVQRRSDLIISGGENIYPSEIEAILLELSEIDAVCILGVDDKDWGQIPIACLELSKDIKVETMVKHLKSRLASFKIPKQWYHCQKIPRTQTGKILRKQLIDQFPSGMIPLH